MGRVVQDLQAQLIFLLYIVAALLRIGRHGIFGLTLCTSLGKLQLHARDNYVASEEALLDLLVL
jgi:hypothetical protein